MHHHAPAKVNLAIFQVVGLTVTVYCWAGKRRAKSSIKSMRAMYLFGTRVVAIESSEYTLMEIGE